MQKGYCIRPPTKERHRQLSQVRGVLRLVFLVPGLRTPHLERREMSKETVTTYHCDYEDKVLSNNAGAMPHLSIIINAPSGRVAPVIGKTPVWKYTNLLPVGVHQFCNADCLAQWVNKVLDEVD